MADKLILDHLDLDDWKGERNFYGKPIVTIQGAQALDPLPDLGTMDLPMDAGLWDELAPYVHRASCWERGTPYPVAYVRRLRDHAPGDEHEDCADVLDTLESWQPFLAWRERQRIREAIQSFGKGMGFDVWSTLPGEIQEVLDG